MPSAPRPHTGTSFLLGSRASVTNLTNRAGSRSRGQEGKGLAGAWTPLCSRMLCSEKWLE